MTADRQGRKSPRIGELGNLPTGPALAVATAAPPAGGLQLSDQKADANCSIKQGTGRAEKSQWDREGLRRKQSQHRARFGGVCRIFSHFSV